MSDTQRPVLVGSPTTYYVTVSQEFFYELTD